MSGDGKILYITNGGSGREALLRAGVQADILCWDDLLHEGPVPANLGRAELSALRAQYVADCGWETLVQARQRFALRDATLAASLAHARVHLLFEHDLCDQLQLLQILDWFAGQKLRSGLLYLSQADDFLGELSGGRVNDFLAAGEPVVGAQLGVARNGWRAFRSANPRDLEKLLRSNLQALPFLDDALYRHLQQFPGRGNGLNRSERQILAVVEAGRHKPGEIFDACQAMEEARYMGDSAFWRYLNGMIVGAAPLLQTDHGGPLRLPDAFPWPKEFGEQMINTTPLAKDVLENRADWLRLQAIDKWYGGVHLTADNLWRWDEHDAALVKA